MDYIKGPFGVEILEEKERPLVEDAQGREEIEEESRQSVFQTYQGLLNNQPNLNNSKVFWEISKVFLAIR